MKKLIALLFVCSMAMAEDSSIQIANGKAKFNALLQSWVLGESNSTSSTFYNFRLRRAELKLSGDLTEEVRWAVMIDPAKSLSTGAVSSTNDNKVLQDLLIVYAPWSFLEFQLGQFKLPTTSEGLDSSGQLLFPERSLLARTYGDKRNTGLQITAKYAMLKLMLMLSNGGNPNTTDTTTPKDLSGRLEAKLLDALSFGGYFWAPDGDFTGYGKYGLFARWAGNNETLRFEWVTATDSATGAVLSTAYVIEGAYRIANVLLPAVRWESITPNTANTLSGRVLTFGLTYDHGGKNNFRVQTAFSLLYNVLGSLGSYSVNAASTSESPERLFVLAAQIAI